MPLITTVDPENSWLNTLTITFPDGTSLILQDTGDEMIYNVGAQRPTTISRWDFADVVGTTNRILSDAASVSEDIVDWRDEMIKEMIAMTVLP